MCASHTLKKQMESLLVSYSFFRKNKHAKTKSRDQSNMLEKKCLFKLVNWKKKRKKTLSDKKERKKTFCAKIWILLPAKKGNLRIFYPAKPGIFLAFASSWPLFRPRVMHLIHYIVKYFYITSPGSEISYFSDNKLSLPQFRPGGSDNKNCSGCLKDSKKMRIIFF